MFWLVFFQPYSHPSCGLANTLAPKRQDSLNSRLIELALDCNSCPRPYRCALTLRDAARPEMGTAMIYVSIAA
jgi:hypothetical protein